MAGNICYLISVDIEAYKGELVSLSNAQIIWFLPAVIMSQLYHTDDTCGKQKNNLYLFEIN